MLHPGQEAGFGIGGLSVKLPNGGKKKEGGKEKSMTISH
jgi:hypothetical protein